MRRAVTLALALSILLPLAAPGCRNAQRGQEHKGAEVTLDQVPAAVRDAFSRESGGAPLGTIVRKRENGKAVYAANITKGAKTWNVEVDEAGKVIRRKEAGK
jgi:hypothetical protein